MMEQFRPRTPLARAILQAYAHGQEDELLEPHLLAGQDGKPVGRIGNGDSVIFYDVRGEREIELSQALTEKNFPHFSTKELDLSFVTMIPYSKELNVQVAFPSEGKIENTLFEVLSKNSLKVVKITEAEKAIHLAYFLNGKREEHFQGEERMVVPTRKDIATFDEAPEMSADRVAAETCRKLADPSAEVVVVNLCNVDVVGHFENKEAVIKAVEKVDESLGKILRCARRNEVTSVITADHGTVERWLYPDGTVDTGHTASPVPFIMDGLDEVTLDKEGVLTDVAPTILELLGIPKPGEMTGKSLIKGGVERKRRVLLLILDGWGYNPDTFGNMIAEADTPNFDRLWETHPRALLVASGDKVGMPEGSVGNSEAGHLHIGAGRRIASDRVRIDEAIADGSFYNNQAFLWAINQAKSMGKALHLMGIVSFYSSYGSVKHLEALLKLCRREKVEQVFVHGMLGRRGEKPQAGARYIGRLEERCLKLGVGRVAGVIGRYWSLDREENWDRIEKTYRWLVEGEGIRVPFVS